MRPLSSSSITQCSKRLNPLRLPGGMLIRVAGVIGREAPDFRTLKRCSSFFYERSPAFALCRFRQKKMFPHAESGYIAERSICFDNRPAAATECERFLDSVYASPSANAPIFERVDGSSVSTPISTICGVLGRDERSFDSTLAITVSGC